MKIVVQRLVVDWTKASRGGAGATLRNAVPSSLALPTMPDTEGTALVHSVRFDEYNGFAQNTLSTEVIGAADLAKPLDELEIEDEGETVRVRFLWSKRIGAPRRSHGASIRVRHGTWCRVLHNGRHPLEHMWYYTQHVLNVGFDLDDCHAFERTSPAVVSDHREALW